MGEIGNYFEDYLGINRSFVKGEVKEDRDIQPKGQHFKKIDQIRNGYDPDILDSGLSEWGWSVEQADINNLPDSVRKIIPPKINLYDLQYSASISSQDGVLGVAIRGENQADKGWGVLFQPKLRGDGYLRVNQYRKGREWRVGRTMTADPEEVMGAVGFLEETAKSAKKM